MFEDVCLVCSRPAEGLYCSDACRDADAVQLPPSSIDLAIDLGFITDSIPPLVASTHASRPQNPDDPSAVSSPTSSILTTPSVMDDLDTDYLPPQSALSPQNAGSQSSATLKPHDPALELLPVPKTPHPQMRSPRLQPAVNQPTLPFVRVPCHTNLHFPPNSGHHSIPPCHSRHSSHRRTASFNITSATGTRITSLSGSSANNSAGHVLSSRAQHQIHQASRHPQYLGGVIHPHSRSSSGHASPALSGVDHYLPPAPDALNFTDGHGHRPPRLHLRPDNSAATPEKERERSRKRRNRASLPAYFSNLMMGHHSHVTSSQVSSSAVSSGTSSPDDRSDIKLSTSASTYKHAMSTRSNSDVELPSSVRHVSSPTTPTISTRKSSADHHLLSNSFSRGRDREKVRGRPRPSAGEAVVCPVTVVRHSDSPPECPATAGILCTNDKPASYAEKHIRFIASGSGSLRLKPRLRLGALVSAGVGMASSRSPLPPTPRDTVPLSAGAAEESLSFSPSSYTLLPRGRGGIIPVSPKTRRYSSPTALGAPPLPLVPISLMMSPAVNRRERRLPHDSPSVVYEDEDGVTKAEWSPVQARRRSSPRPVIRRGWSPLRGRTSVFGDTSESEDAQDDEDDARDEEEAQRGREWRLLMLSTIRRKNLPVRKAGITFGNDCIDYDPVKDVPPWTHAKLAHVTHHGRFQLSILQKAPKTHIVKPSLLLFSIRFGSSPVAVGSDTYDNGYPLPHTWTPRAQRVAHMHLDFDQSPMGLFGRIITMLETPTDDRIFHEQAGASSSSTATSAWDDYPQALANRASITVSNNVNVNPVLEEIDTNTTTASTSEPKNDSGLLQGASYVQHHRRQSSPLGAEASSSSPSTSTARPVTQAQQYTQEAIIDAGHSDQSPASFATRAHPSTAATLAPLSHSSVSSPFGLSSSSSALSLVSDSASRAQPYSILDANTSANSTSVVTPGRRAREGLVGETSTSSSSSVPLGLDDEEAERARKRPRLDFELDHSGRGQASTSSAAAATSQSSSTTNLTTSNAHYTQQHLPSFSSHQQHHPSYSERVAAAASTHQSGSRVTSLRIGDPSIVTTGSSVAPFASSSSSLYTSFSSSSAPAPSFSAAPSNTTTTLFSHPLPQPQPSRSSNPMRSDVASDDNPSLVPEQQQRDDGSNVLIDAAAAVDSSHLEVVDSPQAPTRSLDPSVPPFLPSLRLPSPLSTPAVNALSFDFVSSASTPPPNQNGFSKTKDTNGFAASSSSLSVHDAASSCSSSVVKVNLPGTTIYEDSNIDREEFIRLAIQALRDIGYTESASTLEAESGYSLETPQVAEFRDAVLNGNWDKVAEMLSSMGVGLRDLQAGRYLVSQQHYLELLEQRLTSRALTVLRAELAPNSVDSDKLHILSSLMMCTDPEDLRERAKWDGAEGTSRRKLLSDLQRFIPTHVMLPQRRLATLLDHARAYQRSTRSGFPTLTTNILEHDDEVWNLAWSHDGRYLASASRDKKATIWRIGPEAEGGRDCAAVQVLKDHKYSVATLAWSLDDQVLITGSEQFLKMWDVRTGLLIGEMKGHKQNVSAVASIPNGTGYVSGGMDKKIFFWDLTGHEIDQWVSPSMRVLDLAVTPDSTKLVVVAVVDRESPDAIHHSVDQGFTSVLDSNKGPSKTSSSSSSRTSSHNGAVHNGTGNGSPLSYDDDGGIPMRRRVVIYDLATKEELFKMPMPKEITSISISADSRYALINHAPEELLLWDIVKHRVVRKYAGQKQREDVIRSCFGGTDEDFVLSGSEDSNVYIWRKETGTLVEVLSGHGKGNVNSVAWNPKEVGMFASCSDDKTIRIWEAPSTNMEDISPNGEYELLHNALSKVSSSGRAPPRGYPQRSGSSDAGNLSPRVVR
ncbi:hypothetical protein FRB99_002035 [Tulasnella sp. 403]|nr:hypothetical protein FRB99_002035 [Tulasnella sp. 403]